MRIHMHLKEEGRQLDNQLIANVAAENHFYDFPDDDDQIVEKWLGRDVESRVGPIFKSVVGTESVNALSYSDMHELAFFLSIQYHRTRKFRDLQTDVSQRLLDAAQNYPEHFKEFIIKNSQYRVADAEGMLSREHAELAIHYLEALQLPSNQRAECMMEINREFAYFNQVSTEIRQDLEKYKQGKVSDTHLQTMKYLSENASVRQALSLKMSVPKLARRLLNMNWSVHKYSQDAFRFTSDNPLLMLPTAVPASEDDWEALSLHIMTYLGEVHFYVDEIIEDHPPMIFIFPLTPHLDLFVTPDDDKTSPIGTGLLDQDMADSWNRLQVIQARRFVFSAKNDFSVVPEAVARHVMLKEMVEKRIPARMEDEPHLNKKEPRHKRWMTP